MSESDENGTKTEGIPSEGEPAPLRTPLPPPRTPPLRSPLPSSQMPPPPLSPDDAEGGSSPSFHPPASFSQPPLPAFPMEPPTPATSDKPLSNPPTPPPRPGSVRPPSVELSTAVSGTVPTKVAGAGSGRGASGPQPAAELATTQAGIELGRPLFAVAAIGIALALGGLVIGGSRAALSVGVGAALATANLWVFTRFGTAFFARRGINAPWGLLAILKLIVLFGAVAQVLRSEFASPVAFLVGYLALPIGIVVSQFFGLRHDFENGEGST